MLLLILGAGASFDSVDPRSWSSGMAAGAREGAVLNNFRPPLANDLFDNRPNFGEVLKRFSECAPLVAKLRREKASRGFLLERTLREFQEEADVYPPNHRQLVAIRFYLQHVLWQCGVRWYDEANGVTNYADLLARLDRWRYGRESVCVVTFNYDTLLEKAVTDVLGMTFNALSEYVSSDEFRFIKLHGSVNWTRPVTLPSHAHYQPSEDDARRVLIGMAPDFNLGSYEIREPDKTQQDFVEGGAVKAIHLPAIAIPVEQKAEFACPSAHVDVLNECLEKVDRVLVLGWRATELDFLKMLRPLRDRVRRWLFVNGSREAADDALNNLTRVGLNSLNGIQTPDCGFTGLFADNHLDTFLSD